MTLLLQNAADIIANGKLAESNCSISSGAQCFFINKNDNSNFWFGIVYQLECVRTRIRLHPIEAHEPNDALFDVTK